MRKWVKARKKNRDKKWTASITSLNQPKANFISLLAKHEELFVNILNHEYSEVGEERMFKAGSVVEGRRKS